MLTTINTLQELFSRPSRWTKEMSARDIHQQPVEIDSKKAVSWCLSGAIDLLYPLTAGEIHNKMFLWIKENMDPNIDSLTDWNDAPARKFSDIRKAIIGANL